MWDLISCVFETGREPGEIQVRLLFHPPGSWSHLSEELLQQGGGPVVVQVPVLGRVADVGRVQQQRQGFGFVNAAKREGNQRSSSFVFFVFFVL